jgi:hypothetical protein
MNRGPRLICNVASRQLCAPQISKHAYKKKYNAWPYSCSTYTRFFSTTTLLISLIGGEEEEKEEDTNSCKAIEHAAGFIMFNLLLPSIDYSKIQSLHFILTPAPPSLP